MAPKTSSSRIDRVDLFLTHAVCLEAAAARYFDDLAAAMETLGNREVEKFFRQMADFSRMHLKDAMERGGFRHLPQLAPEEFLWPGGEPPEHPDWAGVDAFTDTDAALQLALGSERRARAWYSQVAASTHDPIVRAMAEEFVVEEGDHVAQLERWVARRREEADRNET